MRQLCFPYGTFSLRLRQPIAAPPDKRRRHRAPPLLRRDLCAPQAPFFWLGNYIQESDLGFKSEAQCRSLWWQNTWRHSDVLFLHLYTNVNFSVTSLSTLHIKSTSHQRRRWVVSPDLFTFLYYTEQHRKVTLNTSSNMAETFLPPHQMQPANRSSSQACLGLTRPVTSREQHGCGMHVERSSSEGERLSLEGLRVSHVGGSHCLGRSHVIRIYNNFICA